MGLSEDEILQILRIIDESNFDELYLEMDNLKLVLKKSAGMSSIQELPAGKLQPISPEPTKLAVSEEKAPPAAKAQEDLATVVTPAAAAEDGLVPVNAPMLGTFYRAPRPGAPPFVEVGALVAENDTLCLIEVMKVFNAVVAGARGRVVKVCAETGQMVEFGQTLFLIHPEGDHQGGPGA